MTLAYVFWHWPAGRDGYVERMQAFHDSLRRPGTVTFRLGRAPFDADEAPFEDWYPVEDWAAIGELGDHAVTGARKAPHDAVATRSRHGAGAVYRLIRPGPALHDVRFAAWLDEPPPETPGTALWRRQLVLGPAPQYALLAGSPVGELATGAVLTAPERVAGS